MKSFLDDEQNILIIAQMFMTKAIYMLWSFLFEQEKRYDGLST